MPIQHFPPLVPFFPSLQIAAGWGNPCWPWASEGPVLSMKNRNVGTKNPLNALGSTWGQPGERIPELVCIPVHGGSIGNVGLITQERQQEEPGRLRGVWDEQERFSWAIIPLGHPAPGMSGGISQQCTGRFCFLQNGAPNGQRSPSHAPAAPRGCRRSGKLNWGQNPTKIEVKPLWVQGTGHKKCPWKVQVQLSGEKSQSENISSILSYWVVLLSSLIRSQHRPWNYFSIASGRTF